jgi:RNA polymerase sigma-70 factor (ECF subfamily)
MDEWVTRLKRDGPQQGDALVELGELLKGRLARAFRGESRVDGSLIDDAVQDSLTSILRSLDQFEGKSKFTTWATTLAVRTVIREMRRLRWKDTSLDQLLADHPGVVENSSARDDPQAITSSAQMIETMYRIINQELTEKQRDVLQAHLGGMPQAEIGRQLGSNRNAIYKLGFDARKKLREGLLAAGYSAADLESLGATR